MVDMNEFARRVTLLEGKKRSVSIAQVKEVLKIAFTLLASYPDTIILNTVNRYNK